MYPVKLAPAYKDYVWGGHKLAEYWGKDIGKPIIAESWELSCHPDGMSGIASRDEWNGKTLKEYIDHFGEQATGTRSKRFHDFPVIIKLIDARNDLSIQVHPGDAYAWEHENQSGKTEAWYILDCEDDAEIVIGLNREMTKELFQEAVLRKRIDQYLNRVKVKKGDCYLIEKGTLHAIGGGIVLAEIQQNSNVTYRVYDYDRIDSTGKKRELHIRQAAEVCDLYPGQQAPEYFPYIQINGCGLRQLVNCSCFAAHELNITQSATLYADERTFYAFTCIDGAVLIESKHGIIAAEKGDTVFVPANTGAAVFTGKCKGLMVYV